MTGPSTSPHAAWWHAPSDGSGASAALELERASRVETRAHTLEVFEHARFGRVLVVDGRLAHVEEDAAWREMLVHVPLLGRASAAPRVLLLGGAPGVLAVPLYPGGSFAFFLYSKDDHSYRRPTRERSLRDDNARIHEGSFALPTWWRALVANP